MTAKARLWTGTTLLIVFAFNYLIIGVPLVRKSVSIKEKTRAILIKEVKSGEILRGSEDEYILELFRKEKSAIDRKVLILNCIGVSLLIIIASWTIFGLAFGKKR